MSNEWIIKFCVSLEQGGLWQVAIVFNFLLVLTIKCIKIVGNTKEEELWKRLSVLVHFSKFVYVHVWYICICYIPDNYYYHLNTTCLLFFSKVNVVSVVCHVTELWSLHLKSQVWLCLQDGFLWVLWWEEQRKDTRQKCCPLLNMSTSWARILWIPHAKSFLRKDFGAHWST